MSSAYVFRIAIMTAGLAAALPPISVLAQTSGRGATTSLRQARDVGSLSRSSLQGRVGSVGGRLSYETSSSSYQRGGSGSSTLSANVNASLLNTRHFSGGIPGLRDPTSGRQGLQVQDFSLRAPIASALLSQSVTEAPSLGQTSSRGLSISSLPEVEFFRNNFTAGVTSVDRHALAFGASRLTFPPEMSNAPAPFQSPTAVDPALAGVEAGKPVPVDVLEMTRGNTSFYLRRALTRLLKDGQKRDAQLDFELLRGMTPDDPRVHFGLVLTASLPDNVHYTMEVWRQALRRFEPRATLDALQFDFKEIFADDPALAADMAQRASALYKSLLPQVDNLAATAAPRNRRADTPLPTANIRMGAAYYSLGAVLTWQVDGNLRAAGEKVRTATELEQGLPLRERTGGLALLSQLLAASQTAAAPAPPPSSTP